MDQAEVRPEYREVEAVLEPPLPLRWDVLQEVGLEVNGKCTVALLVQEGTKGRRGKPSEPDQLVGAVLFGTQPWVLWAFRLYCELMERRFEVSAEDKRALWLKFKLAKSELGGKRPRIRRKSADVKVVRPGIDETGGGPLWTAPPN